MMFICVAAASAWADTAYFTTVDGYQHSSWTNAYNWARGSLDGERIGDIGAPLPEDMDYFVPSGKVLRTPMLGTRTFPGRSLTVGTAGTPDWPSLTLSLSGNDHQTLTFGNLVLASGLLNNLGGRKPHLAGNITVTSTTDFPLHIYDNAATSAIWFDGSFSGGSEAAIWIHTRNNHTNPNWSSTNTTCHFTGDVLKDYAGQITCCQYNFNNRNLRTNDTFRATLSSGTVETPARVTLYPYGAIQAEAATDIVSVAELLAKDGACINVTYDNTLKTGSCIVARNSFVREGKVTIRFSPGFRYATSNDDFVPEFPVFKAPVGTTLSLDDFVLETSCVFPDYELRVGTDGEGLPTLYLGQTGQIVVQNIIDSNAADERNYMNYGTFFSGAHWSDGLPPDPTNFYYSAMEMRTYDPAKPNPVIFAGRVLARNGGGALEPQTADNAVTHIADLRFVGDAESSIINYASTPRRLTGRIRCWQDTADKILKLNSYTGRFLDIGSDIEGWGTLYVSLYNASILTISHVRLSGVNTNFTGKLVVTAHAPGKTTETSYIELSCPDARALGGPMAAWTYDGHQFTAHSTFIPDGSMTLNRKNCGLYLLNAATFNVTNGTLTVLERFTWCGHLTKKGAGTLALGGERPTFVTSTSYTPVADTNVLIVAAGSLKPLSAAAFDGVAVTMASGTTLALDMPTNFTADIGKYGMALTNALAGLTLPAEGVAVTLANPSGVALRSCVVPICTVATTAADALDGKFNCAPGHPFAGYSATVTRTDNSDGTTTFGVALVRGTTLFIR